MVLETIREKTTGIIAIFILVLLAIPFAFVGVNSYFSSGTGNLVALVDDQEITFTDFNQSFLDFRRQMQSMMGAAFDPAEFDSPIARREHLDRMIEETVLRSAADSLGLEVDNEFLSEQIRAIPVFQVDGEFSMPVYQSRLLAEGYTVPQFENEMRSSIVLRQLPASVLDSSFVTDSELEQFVTVYDQTRSFQAVVVPADAASAESAFSDEQVDAWYEDNKNSFMTEEQVILQYLQLSADSFGPFEPPTEEALTARFEEQKGRFITPERRQVSHILIEVSPDADDATRETARQEAADLTERARAGEDFAVLATESSDDLGSASQGGDLGWVDPGFMVESFENAMYELSLQNPVSDPVQTSFGWHVILLTDIQAAEGQGFEEARLTLIDEYNEEEAERAYLDAADLLVDVVYEDPTTLEGAALDSGLEIQILGPFSRAGGEGLAGNSEIVQAAFSDLVLLQGSVSDPIDVRINSMVLLRLEEHLPVTQQPVEEVRDQIVAALQAEAALAMAEERAGVMMVALSEGQASLEELAAEAGLEVIDVEAGTRRDFLPDATVVEEVFRLAVPTGDVTVQSVVPADDGFAVVNLRSVTDGSLEAGGLIAGTQYRRQIANANAGVERLALLKQLRNGAEVQVFEENLGVSR